MQNLPLNQKMVNTYMGADISDQQTLSDAQTKVKDLVARYFNFTPQPDMLSEFTSEVRRLFGNARS